MSISAAASAATTFVRVPPEMTPGIHGQPALEVRETGDLLDLPRQLQDRARAGRKVDARVRGLAL